MESEPDKLVSEAMRDDELFGVDSLFVSSKVLKPWNELTKKRKTQFGRDFKKPFEDFLLAYIPKYSTEEAISVVDELFSISKTKSAAKLSTALQAAYKREDSPTIAEIVCPHIIKSLAALGVHGRLNFKLLRGFQMYDIVHNNKLIFL